MQQAYSIAALWLGLAVASAALAYHLRLSVALVENCVGVAVASLAGGLGPAPSPVRKRNGGGFWPAPAPCC